MDVVSFSIAFFVVVLTFLAMEGVAWLAHKYLMHGAMWYFHEDHHSHGPGFLKERCLFRHFRGTECLLLYHWRSPSMQDFGLA